MDDGSLFHGPSRTGDGAIELIVAGEARYRANALAAHQRTCEWRQSMERGFVERQAEAERQRRERALQAEKQRQGALLEMAASYSKARRIRVLIDQVVLAHGTDAREDGGVVRWAAWAGAVADRIDPVPRLSFDASGRASLAAPVLPEPDLEP